MTIYTSMPGPALPQMDDDGCINSAELTGDGGVVVSVSRYSNADDDDYLRLYWDGKEFNAFRLADPQTYDWPWTTIIPAENAPDGPHQVYYTVTDVAGNYSSSAISTAVVDRNHTSGLQPPQFIDAVDGKITYSSVLQHNGTRIHVPDDSVLDVGDTVYVYWGEFDEQSAPVPDSQTSQTHIVSTEDISGGFDVLIAPPFVIAVNQGTASAWYSVIGAESAQSSATATVNIDMSASAIYPAPVIPDASDGWLDCTEIAATSGTEIIIPANTQFVAGGTITVYWQGYNETGSVISTYWSASHTVSGDDVTQGFSLLIPQEFITPIGIGSAQAWYQVTETPGTSSSAQVNVDSLHCSALPAPTFPEASDGVIDQTDATDGTPMIISYPDMMLNDRVNLSWIGLESDASTPVPGTEYSLLITVSQQQVDNQQISVTIPPDNITPIGNGYARGSYDVDFFTGGRATSTATTVAVNLTTSSSLQVMGARRHYVTYWGGSANLVALDKGTGLPVEAQWSYEGEEWITTTYFLDTRPDLRLQVRRSAEQPVTLNVANLCGNGGETYMTSCSFAAIQNGGVATAWGGVGGVAPPASDINKDVIMLASTADAFCGMNSAGQVLTWGGDYPLPAGFDNSGIVYIYSNLSAFVALKEDHHVVAWANEAYGGLLPDDIANMDNIISVAASASTFAALRDDGSVVSWGDYDFGIPPDIAAMTNIVSVTGAHDAFAALTTEHRVVAWGSDTFGGEVPEAIAARTDIISLAAASMGFAALCSDGQVVSWGDCATTDVIAELTDVVSVVGTHDAFAAVRSGGQVVAWGFDGAGVLPDELVNKTNIVCVTASGGAFTALLADGHVVAWGDEEYGGILPPDIAALNNVRAVYANTSGFCALLDNSSLVAWGAGPAANVPSTLQGTLSYEVKDL